MSVSSEVRLNPRFQFLDNKWVTIHPQETDAKEVFRWSCSVSYNIEQRNGLHYHDHEYFLFILESSSKYYFIRYPEQRDIVKRKVTEGCCVPRLSEIIPKIYECTITKPLPVPPKDIRSYPSEYKNALIEIQSFICANFFKTALKITDVFEKTQRSYSDTLEEEGSSLVYASDTNGNVKVVGEKQKEDPLPKPELVEMNPLSQELILTLRRALSGELQPPAFEQRQEETPPRIRRGSKKTPSPGRREKAQESSPPLPKREQDSALNGLLLLGEPGFEKRGVLQRRLKKASPKKENPNPDTPEPKPQPPQPELISAGSTISSGEDQKRDERSTSPPVPEIEEEAAVTTNVTELGALPVPEDETTIKNASQQTDQATNADAYQQTDEFIARAEVKTQCNIVNPTTSIAIGPEQTITTRDADQQTDQIQLNTTGTDPEREHSSDAAIQTEEYVERTERETQYDITEPGVSVATGPEQIITTRDTSQQTDEFIIAGVENVHRPLKERITRSTIFDEKQIRLKEAAKKVKSLAFYVFCFTIPITIIFGPLITAAFYSHQITMLLTPLIPFFI